MKNSLYNNVFQWFIKCHSYPGHWNVLLFMHLFLFLCLFFVFKIRDSLYSSSKPGIYYIAEDGLRLAEIDHSLPDPSLSFHFFPSVQSLVCHFFIPFTAPSQVTLEAKQECSKGTYTLSYRNCMTIHCGRHLIILFGGVGSDTWKSWASQSQTTNEKIA